jgi:hypothetical protein
VSPAMKTKRTKKKGRPRLRGGEPRKLGVGMIFVTSSPPARG